MQEKRTSKKSDYVYVALSLAATYYVQRKMKQPENQTDDFNVTVAFKIYKAADYIAGRSMAYINRELDRRKK